MKKIVILGAGLVGKAMAVDLCREFQVISVDINPEHLQKLRDFPIQTVAADLSDQAEIKRVIANADLVIGAVPGFMGYQTLETVIENGKNVVDISFFAEDPFLLDELAQRNNVTAVIDCGVAPGMSNMILGYYSQKMNVTHFECLVGGLPVVRTMPYQYKAPFSPIDVLEEYIRPARLVENGEIVIKPALSEPEYVEFDGIGTLEAFNTDGLRTLLKTVKIPHMKEKTLRYPGHIDLIHVLRESGFLNKDPILVGDVSVRPIDVASKLLFPIWQLQEMDDELTVMRVTIRGEAQEIVYHLFDRYQQSTKTSSMARTTGYTCTITARLILDGTFNRKGICPPEYVGMNETCFKQILTQLKNKGVEYQYE